MHTSTVRFYRWPSVSLTERSLLNANAFALPPRRCNYPANSVAVDLRDAISRLTAVSLSTLSVSLCPFSRVSAALNAYCLRMWPLAGVEIMFASSLADETGHKIISKWKSN